MAADVQIASEDQSVNFIDTSWIFLNASHIFSHKLHQHWAKNLLSMTNLEFFQHTSVLNCKISLL